MSLPPLEASIHQIFDLLLAGKKLQLSFPSSTAAETFRTSLYRYKRRQTDQLEGLGMLEESETTSLSWAASSRIDGTTLVAMKLVPKKKTLYTVMFIEEDSNVGTEEKVSGSLGEA